MKARVQLYSTKGFLGPELKIEFNFVANMPEALLKALDKLPDKFEGVSVVDWSRMIIEIER